DGIRDFHVTGVQTCALPIWAEVALATLAHQAHDQHQDREDHHDLERDLEHVELRRQPEQQAVPVEYADIGFHVLPFVAIAVVEATAGQGRVTVVPAYWPGRVTPAVAGCSKL